VRVGVPPHACPCCGYLTLSKRAGFEICLCFWEDDGQNSHDAQEVRGGTNGGLSLAAARDDYARLGACGAGLVRHTRPPLPHEIPISHAS
jgi:Cysteine-rich CPCC